MFTSCPFLSNSNGANKIELWSCMRSQWVFEWKSQKDQNGAFFDFIWLLLSMTQRLPIEKISNVFKSNHNKVQQYKCKLKSKLQNLNLIKDVGYVKKYWNKILFITWSLKHDIRWTSIRCHNTNVSHISN